MRWWTDYAYMKNDQNMKFENWMEVRVTVHNFAPGYDEPGYVIEEVNGSPCLKKKIGFGNADLHISTYMWTYPKSGPSSRSDPDM